MLGGVVIAVTVELTTGALESGFGKIRDYFFPPAAGLAVHAKAVNPVNTCENGGGYVFPQPVSKLDRFIKGYPSEEQVHEAGGAAAEYQIIELTLQRTKPVTVSVDNVVVNIKKTLPPPERGTHLTYICQGGGVEVRTFAFDLDRSAGKTYSIVGRPPKVGGREQPERLPAEPDPEKSLKIYVVPYGLKHGYRFTLTVEWKENGKDRKKEIDNNGEPFVVMPARGAASYLVEGWPTRYAKRSTYRAPWFLPDAGE